MEAPVVPPGLFPQEFRPSAGVGFRHGRRPDTGFLVVCLLVRGSHISPFLRWHPSAGDARRSAEVYGHHQFPATTKKYANFTLLDLSLGFWANGGHAEAWDLDAFIYGLTSLSGSDILVLAWTLEELHHA